MSHGHLGLLTMFSFTALWVAVMKLITQSYVVFWFSVKLYDLIEYKDKSGLFGSAIGAMA